MNYTGTSGNDSIVGSSDDDIINGNGGADTLVGGHGNDTYIDDLGTDAIVENANEGFDTVQTAKINYKLGANLEKLVLTSVASQHVGIGNELDNVIVDSATRGLITGGAGNDTLWLGGGNDVGWGGDGNDVLHGEDGDDQLNGDDGAAVAPGNDTLIGGAGNDILRGGAGSNELHGGDGNDTLESAGTYDLLYGGAGDDLFIVHSSTTSIVWDGESEEGNDTLQAHVSFDLAALEVIGVETVQLMGNADLTLNGYLDTDILIGNAGDNYISDEWNSTDTLSGMGGNDSLVAGSGDDVLDGGSGADLMAGEAGNDYYIVDDLGDEVFEDVGDGIDYDIVESSVSFVLNDTTSAGIEGLVLTGLAQLSATGNSLNNLLMANDAGNALNGANGDDELIGGMGADTLTGGIGWDILEGGAGTDQLFGGEGDDQLAGGDGNDLLQGGNGSDIYRQSGNFGVDTLSDSGGTLDVLSFLDVNRDQLWFSRSGQNLEVIKIGSADKVIVQNWFASSGQLESVQSADGFGLSQSGVANLVQAMSAFNPQALSGAPASVQNAVQNAWTPIAV